WLVPLVLLERDRFGGLDRRQLSVCVVAGVFFAADLLFWHHAIDAVGAGLATVLANMQVVVVAVAAWLLFGERPSRASLIALPLMLLGVVLISGVVGSGAYGADPVLGVVFGVLAAIGYGGYLLVIRHGLRGTGGPATPLFVSSATTALVAAVVGAGSGALDPLPSWPAHGWLAIIGLTSQAAGYLLISLSLPRLPALITSIILLAQPVATVVFSAVLLAEAPSASQLAGVVLVVGGLVIANVGRGARSASAAASPSPAVAEPSS
ncbi:MAG TPA: DMT family transporter, partial [Candidatus Limnocylindrales bacterium]